MRTINLLPRVPYIVRRRRWLVMLTGVIGLLLLVVQLFLHIQWENDSASLERELQSVSDEVNRLQRLTTKSETTAAFERALNMAHQLEAKQPDWEALLQPLLGSVQMDGQLQTIEAGEDRTLKVTSIYLTEDDVTSALAKLEKSPQYLDMKLTVTEHMKGESPGKIALINRNGQLLKLDNFDYYTLALEIRLQDRQEESTP